MKRTLIVSLTISIILFAAPAIYAHCDTVSGPVVQAAKEALESGRIDATLKWIQEAREPELRTAFQHALKARKAGDEAKEIAERYFIETLVRIHREGEGEAFRGLKFDAVDPLIAAADKSIASGKVDEVEKMVAAHVTKVLRERHARVVAAEAHADDSVAAGRAYVAAYVEFMHTLEGIHNAIGSSHAPAAANEHKH